MAVGTSQPTVVATKDGRIGMKNQMQVWKSRLIFGLIRSVNSCPDSCSIVIE